MPVRLDELQAGQRAEVHTIAGQQAELMALRLGIGVGETLTCLSKVPGGPVVISKGGAELALGQSVAQEIEVHLL